MTEAMLHKRSDRMKSHEDQYRCIVDSYQRVEAGDRRTMSLTIAGRGPNGKHRA